MSGFYVYTYLDPRKPGRFIYKSMSFLYEPFYVGKGCDRRYSMHLRAIKRMKNGLFKHKLTKLLSDFSNEQVQNHILILRNNLLEQEAFDLEKQLIEEIGRTDLHSGPLTNLTDGGGTPNNLSEEIRKRMSETHKGKCLPAATREKMSRAKKGHTFSEETLKKLSEAKKGKCRSIETRRKISETKKGKRCSEETKKKISAAHKGKSYNPKGMLGQYHSEETKLKMSRVRLKYWEDKRSKHLMEGV